ncbi:MAG: hypothetical protein HRU69_14560 [Flammeovirgaceae bacterium]|nr:MAG: hypothetical protein HRU69_14560 [Flammeovirgaceae bacterium]
MIQILLLLICLFAYRASAQPDYVVTVKGDTVYGKIRLLNYNNDQKIQLTDASRKKTIYGKLQFKVFTIAGDLYHPIRTPQGYVIMKLLKPGYLSLYAFQMENQITWDGQYLYKRDGAGLEVSSLLFKKRLTNFLAECSELAAKIESKELSRNDLEEIIDQFNECIDQRTKEAATQSAIASKLDELETAVKALEESENKTTALEVITELRLKVQRGEKVPSLFGKTLLDALTAYPELTELAQAALREVQR